MSFTKLVYHFVFPTKNRFPSIVESGERVLHRVLYEIMKNEGAFVYRIGGMPDHVHVLVDVPTTQSISRFAQKVKQQSSYIAFQMNELPQWDGWAEGYGCFTCSANDIEDIKNYIISQKEHHRKVPFIEEYRNWLVENGISPDAPYFPK